jgi:hypothetical protein
MNEDELKTLLSTMQDQIRQLQDVIAGGPDGVQAQWNDQGNYAKALSEMKSEMGTIRSALNTVLPNQSS